MDLHSSLLAVLDSHAPPAAVAAPTGLAPLLSRMFERLLKAASELSDRMRTVQPLSLLLLRNGGDDSDDDAADGGRGGSDAPVEPMEVESSNGSCAALQTTRDQKCPSSSEEGRLLRRLYLRLHRSLAQLLYLLTGEKLPWRDSGFGAASAVLGIPGRLEPLPRDASLAPLSEELQPEALGDGFDGASDEGSSEDDRQHLLIWHLAEPLITAYFHGRGHWQENRAVRSEDQADAGGSALGPSHHPLPAEDLSKVRALVERLVKGIAPPAESILELSGVRALLDDPHFDDGKAIVAFAEAAAAVVVSFEGEGSEPRTADVWMQASRNGGPGEVDAAHSLARAVPSCIRRLLLLPEEREPVAEYSRPSCSAGQPAAGLQLSQGAEAWRHGSKERRRLLHDRLVELERISGPVRFRAHRTLYRMLVESRPSADEVLILRTAVGSGEDSRRPFLSHFLENHMLHLSSHLAPPALSGGRHHRARGRQAGPSAGERLLFP